MKLLKNILVSSTLILIVTVFFACKKNDTDTNDNSLTELEEEIKNDLNNISTDTDFTLMIKSESGKSFTHSTGNSSETKMYESASTSKLVTATVILSLVKDGKLSLEDNPQKYISFWPNTGNLSLIKLKHLLNFTSGLVNEPICIHLAFSNFENCVETIAEKNSSSKIPGTEFYYSSAHLQVAGLMAIKASGLSSWEALFEQFKSQTGLFSNSNYDLPSLQNPRLAGGMHWNTKEYLEFLEALYKKEILNSDLILQMTSDQINGVTIGYSPATEDWHYGYGTWIECYDSGNCTQIISCAGAYGAYPFIDFDNKYFGVLGRQGLLGTFENGYALFSSISPKLEKWAIANQ